MNDLKEMKNITLPKPLPQSYPTRRTFLLKHKKKIGIISKGKGRGLRYYISQGKVNDFCNKFLGLA